MKVSENGLKLLAEWEELRTHEYIDSAGYPTIGVGHLLTKSEIQSGSVVIKGKAVPYKNGLTKQQCFDLFEQDLEPKVKVIKECVKVPLTQEMFDCLVSFVFNVGEGAFKNSTLLKLLNQGQYDQIPDQLKRWNKSKGQVIAGLTNRRNKEIALWVG
jgi:lysozyme